VAIKKHGVNYTASCPFHAEKSASFTVSDTKDIYKCFGCGASGDAIKFVMEHQRQDFLQAVETIANHAGIAIEYDSSADNEKYKAVQAQKASMATVLNQLINIYKQNLLTLPQDHPVKTYLTGRGITNEIIIEWDLGWATTDWRHLTPRLIADGNFEHASAMGIIKKGKADDSNYDGYRSRIIVPIQNQFGQHIGIAGRYLMVDEKDISKCNALKDEAKQKLEAGTITADVYADEVKKAENPYPKWINPTENELYNKSTILFGLNRAAKAIKEKQCAWLVEGYFDCIAMHTYGDNNTVATCGTAFTTQQAALLKKHTSHAILLRDNDTAGQKATSKDLNTLIAASFKTDVATLPADFKDCDELIQSLNKNNTQNEN